METVVDIVGSEGVVEDCITSQKAADPVVYQLVRVDGNGILVPATDDEVMAVEDLLEDCKSKVRNMDTGQNLESCGEYGCEPCGSSKVQVKGSEGHRRLEALDFCAEKPNIPPAPAMDQDEKKISPLVPKSSDESGCQPRSLEGCSKLPGLDESKTSSPTTGAGLRPDFSLLNGEIHLECLSVRDLQETFRATFGRETSVKDKQWLKRRIIMGLTNSCDFSTTSFIIIDNKVVRKGKENTCKNVDCTVLVDHASPSAIDSHQSQMNLDDKPVETRSVANEMDLQSSNLQEAHGSQDAGMEQQPAKRIRKPTKRYIEELSEGESRDSGAKFVSSIKQSSYDQPSARACAGPVRCFTRSDSIGGSGIQVPFVSRIRRSRPRENFMALMKLHPSGIGIPTRVEKNDAASSVMLENESGTEVLKNSSSPRLIEEPIGASSATCKLYIETDTNQLEKEVALKNLESYKNDADDEVATVPNTNGGMRRKHHRPWSLTEVVQLVEGVAKYGAGKWSEIKRVSFASYSYRTSVDLKDKWRNLLRASVSELAAEKGVPGSRKQASVPIPAPILSRVRELANLQTATCIPGSFSSIKLPGLNDSSENMRESRPGFL